MEHTNKEPRPQGGALKPKLLNPKLRSRNKFGMTKRQEPNPYVMLNSFQHLVCFFLPSADAPFIPVHRMGFSGETFNKKGITLLELVVVMIIIAIGAVLLVPNIGGWLPHYRLKSSTRDIASTMRIAQMKAVSNNFQYRVNLNSADVGANSYILQYNTGGIIWVDDGAMQRLPSGIIISNNTFPNDRAEFNPNSTSSSGSVTLQNSKGAQKRITLTSATGRIKIE